ncbi:MAG: hypothetical protein HN353_14225 [Bdellovibrionales bacterium]|jgi:hypothetical protein|nr:hypothetical protein [Bdellovibrionales bacterium]MBT3527002.1 hypothetical protein [Bdellovibrionales bacterium]MBT7669507.1 hypothetical protein [Bdellovibrionales bacterium]MBT7766333.1 hypothetical protein [Bdellovibrionales bacterium]
MVKKNSINLNQGSLTPNEANRLVERVLHWGEPKPLTEELRSSLFDFIMRYWMQLDSNQRFDSLAKQSGCDIQLLKKAMESHNSASIDDYLEIIEGLGNSSIVKVIESACTSIKETKI